MDLDLAAGRESFDDVAKMPPEIIVDTRTRRGSS